MKKIKFLIWSLVLVLGLSAVIVNASTNSSTSSQPAKNEQSTTKTQQPAPKISTEKATQIALAAHKGATIIDITLAKNVYLIHLQTSQGKRTLKIGANTGRILLDTSDTAKPSPKVSPAKTTTK